MLFSAQQISIIAEGKARRFSAFTGFLQFMQFFRKNYFSVFFYYFMFYIQVSENNCRNCRDRMKHLAIQAFRPIFFRFPIAFYCIVMQKTPGILRVFFFFSADVRSFAAFVFFPERRERAELFHAFGKDSADLFHLLRSIVFAYRKS